MDIVRGGAFRIHVSADEEGKAVEGMMAEVLSLSRSHSHGDERR